MCSFIRPCSILLFKHFCYVEAHVLQHSSCATLQPSTSKGAAGPMGQVQISPCCQPRPDDSEKMIDAAALPTGTYTSKSQEENYLREVSEPIPPKLEADCSEVLPTPSLHSNGEVSESQAFLGGPAGDQTLTFKGDSTYKGQVLNGKRHGYGVLSCSSKMYEGTWEDGRRHGRGKQTWKDGRTYEGEFSMGQLHGDGTMSWQSAFGTMSYVGQYRDNMKHGMGRFSWPDGRVYRGNWKDGMRNGEGEFISTWGQQRKGVWKDDVLQEWIDGIPSSKDAPANADHDSS